MARGLDHFSSIIRTWIPKAIWFLKIKIIVCSLTMCLCIGLKKKPQLYETWIRLFTHPSSSHLDNSPVNGFLPILQMTKSKLRINGLINSPQPVGCGRAGMQTAPICKCFPLPLACREKLVRNTFYSVLEEKKNVFTIVFCCQNS